MANGAQVLTGKEVAAAVRQKIMSRVAGLASRGITPTLQVLRVGERADDVHYERSIKRACEQLGIGYRHRALPTSIDQAGLERAIQELNRDDQVHGIMLFEPLPQHLDEKSINGMISPLKDVDGLTPTNQAAVYQGRSGAIAPSTSAAVVRTLKHYDIALGGANVVVVGRSMVVGKPLAMLLLSENATVTICHSRTSNLAEQTRRADIVIAAVGRKRMLDGSYVSAEQVVIDVGIHEEDDALVGDVDFESVAPIVSAITPARGGIGAVTTATLLENLMALAERAI